jgi:CRISPR type III-B/RAMP module-associated protein Cmr5
VDAVQPGAWQKYSSRAKELPAMLRTSGVVATVAYLGSKKDTKPIAEDLIAELWRGPMATGVVVASSDVEGALRELTKATTTELRRAEEHARRFADWLKRAAEVRGIEVEDAEKRLG